MQDSSFSTKLKQEFFGGWTKFEAGWLLTFLAIQIAIFIYQPDSWIATIAAITGILCVVFVGKGKISNYFFGLISVSLYAYISYTFQLYGEMMLNLLVYVPVQFIGFYFWRKNMTSQNTVNNAGVEEVIAKALTAKQWGIVIISAIIGTFLYVELLKYLNSALPVLDGATVVISIVAQILMVLRYREQWALWIIVNIMTISLWTAMYYQNGETSLPLLVMYVMYLCNSIYGYYNWIKLHRNHQQEIR